jgi:hypothetical protein
MSDGAKPTHAVEILRSSGRCNFPDRDVFWKQNDEISPDAAALRDSAGAVLADCAAAPRVVAGAVAAFDPVPRGRHRARSLAALGEGRAFPAGENSGRTELGDGSVQSTGCGRRGGRPSIYEFPMWRAHLRVGHKHFAMMTS